MMKYTLKTLCYGALMLTFLPFINANAQDIENKKIVPDEIKVISENHELTADGVSMKKELAILDSLMHAREIEEESEEAMTPADELYDGQWNNQYVKAYKNITVPDSFRIDLSDFVMPFQGRVTSKYGPRRRRFHYGTDIKLYKGDTVVAAFDGKVRVKKYERRGYGYYLVLRHNNGLETVYGHLSKFLVEEGETIKAGQAIALGGSTGRSTGSHLHFECRFLGQPINPAEIVDFDNFCTFDDSYLYVKNKSGNSSGSDKYTASSSSSDKVRYHRIRQGDTLLGIAMKYHTTVDKLCRLNKIRKTTVLRVGRTLRLS
ncbi:MAG: peptidoglycan DD-metalloendopeptidase family protein [Dysgonamonadaceae bacterium]|jgi:murein DD-endopeptidase MepM/ murein hydrolase activator NlpD|nr:peptidoglycan DD-metalloendopeptidase family protein [Dysgonamonadaceae bacterium]